MHIAMISRVLLGAAFLVAIGANAAIAGDSAYISQASSSVGAATPTTVSPTQIVPNGNYAQRQTAFVPTPETTRARSTNLANTVEIGNSNSVLQLQSGGKNTSNVGAIGNDTNVSVLQGGKDYSNVAVINTQSTQGLSVAVIQPPGSAPVNMLIAKLPNGSILIKR